MHKRDLAFLLALIVILFGIYWKTFNYDLIWDDESLFKHNLLFIEDHPISTAFKMGYFSDQARHPGTGPLLPARPRLHLHDRKQALGDRAFDAAPDQSAHLFLRPGCPLLFSQAPERISVFPRNRHASLRALSAQHGQHCLGRRAGRPPHVSVGGALLPVPRSLPQAAADVVPRPVLRELSPGRLLQGNVPSFFPLLVVYEAAKRKKITALYHLANLGILGVFFFVKNYILSLKNVKFVLRTAVGEDIRGVIGTLGYYFRTMVYPLRYNLFVPIQEAMKTFYVGLGVIAGLLMLFLLLGSLKDRRYLMPAVLLVVFTGAHVLLIFTNVFPFQIYSRYMMVSGLALIWILALVLSKLREKQRFVAAFALLVLFIPAIVLNGGSYKNKELFWERAAEALPKDAYVLSQSAKTAFEDKDYLNAELLLNRSLSTDMKRETAILVSSTYADLEIARADYVSALRWLASIEEFESQPNVKIAPFVRYQLNEKKAEIETAKGEGAAAEALLEDNLARYSAVKESYTRLYDLYIGREMWDKAAAVEKTMKAIYPVYFHRIDTASAKRGLRGDAAQCEDILLHPIPEFPGRPRPPQGPAEIRTSTASSSRPSSAITRACRPTARRSSPRSLRLTPETSRSSIRSAIST